jgi:hypothetical protein
MTDHERKREGIQTSNMNPQLGSQSMHVAGFTAETSTAVSLIGRLSHLPRMARERLIFFSILAFVGGVSIYDAYCVLRTGEEIRLFEKNPVGLCLIEFNHGDATLFLIAKGIGTSVVLASLTVLYRRSQRMAFPVAYSLLLFQTGLLVYLESAW